MTKVAVLTEKQMQEMADEVAELRARIAQLERENDHLMVIERAAWELVAGNEKTFLRDLPEVENLRQALAALSKEE